MICNFIKKHFTSQLSRFELISVPDKYSVNEMDLSWVGSLNLSNSAVVIEGYKFDKTASMKNLIELSSKASMIEFKKCIFLSKKDKIKTKISNLNIKRITFSCCIFISIDILKDVLIYSEFEHELCKISFTGLYEEKERESIDDLMIEYRRKTRKNNYEINMEYNEQSF